MNTHPQLDTVWRQWIRENRDRGCSRESLIESMAGAGWHPAAASIALDQFDQEEVLLPPAVRVPEPDLSGRESTIEVRGRAIRVITHLSLPRLVVFANLLTDDECDQLISEARSALAPSTVVDAASGRHENHEGRVSDGMFFRPGQTALVAEIESRIAELVRWPVSHAEGLQVLRYSPDGKYEPHHDYFWPGHEGTEQVLAVAGQRVGTVILYLNTPEAGGATAFPEVGLEVVAQKGNAVFFSYERPHACTKTLHAGLPVLRGEKWIATKWLREKAFPVESER